MARTIKTLLEGVWKYVLNMLIDLLVFQKANKLKIVFRNLLNTFKNSAFDTMRKTLVEK